MTSCGHYINRVHAFATHDLHALYHMTNAFVLHKIYQMSAEKSTKVFSKITHKFWVITG